MLSGEQDPRRAAAAVMRQLMNYKGTTEHGQHFPAEKCRAFGLKVIDIEADQGAQEDILSVHHAFVATFARTNSIKIIENAIGGNWNISA